ncbi:MAG: hypothetical protein M3O71_21610 [Bacteroidota bacterium]|nr:hypothetical protein [Bacteroidota bacterium]
MKTSIYLFKRCSGQNSKKNIFLRELGSTNDFMELEKFYKEDKKFNYGLEMSIDFLGKISIVYLQDEVLFQSPIVDWNDEDLRFVGQYLPNGYPIIMEFHSNDKIVHLFHSASYTDLKKFVADFRSIGNLGNDLEKSFTKAFDKLNGLIVNNKTDEN